MGAAVKFPLTRRELADIGGPGLVRFPATFDEYWELLEEAEYTADFYQNEIIATSYETDLHSKLTTRLSFLLTAAFLARTTLTVHDSNRPIYMESCEEDETGVFNPEGSVVSQPPVYFEYRPGMNAETTPVVLFIGVDESRCTLRYQPLSIIINFYQPSICSTRHETQALNGG